MGYGLSQAHLSNMLHNTNGPFGFAYFIPAYEDGLLPPSEHEVGVFQR